MDPLRIPRRRKTIQALTNKEFWLRAGGSNEISGSVAVGVLTATYHLTDRKVRRQADMEF